MTTNEQLNKEIATKRAELDASITRIAIKNIKWIFVCFDKNEIVLPYRGVRFISLPDKKTLQGLKDEGFKVEEFHECNWLNKKSFYVRVSL